MHAVLTAALVLVTLLGSTVALATTDGPVATLLYQGEESTEQPFTSVEQTTDADFVAQAENAASSEASTDLQAGFPEDILQQKVETLSSDLLKFIEDVPKISSKKPWNRHSNQGDSKAKDIKSFKFGLKKLLMNCVKKFGGKCVKIVQENEYHRLKREAQKQHEDEPADNAKNLEHFFPSILQHKSSHANVAEEDIPKDESVTQYVFRELQNLLSESRSDLQDESKEVKFVETNLNEPVNSEFYLGVGAVSKPSNTNPHYYEKTTPLLKLTTAQPVRQNSLSIPDILLSKFHTSSPKNRFSELDYVGTTLPSTTESGINLASAIESRPYQSTHSTRRYPRSTTSQGSTFKRNDPYYIRTPSAVYPAHEVTQGYGDYVVDYVTADYETTNPKQTLKKLLSQSAIQNPSSENVQYEIVSSYPESYDESDFPMYEYFVISEHPEPEPSQLSLPTHQEQAYLPEKQVYEETRVPVQLVTGNRVSPASSTRFISTTPLSDDELYHIIKERIPSSSHQPPSFNVEQKPVNAQQQESFKFSTDDQLRSPGNFESPRSSTPSFSFKSPVHKKTTYPTIVTVQHPDDNTLHFEPDITYTFKSSVPEETTKPLIVKIQEPEDVTNLPNFQTGLITTAPDTTVVTNSYTSNLPTSGASVVTKPPDATVVTNSFTTTNLPTSSASVVTKPTDTTVVTNSYTTTNLPTSSASVVTKPTDTSVVTNSYTTTNLPTSSVSVVAKPITESTSTEQEIGLTTTLQDLITAIENQLGATAIAVEEPLRTDIPMQVTVTSDEITVSGPDTQSISTLLYELRQPLLTSPPPPASFVLPHVDTLKPVEVDPMQFAEFTSSVKKPQRKPSISTLFTNNRPFAVSSISTRIQSIPEDAYRTSASVQTEGLAPQTEGFASMDNDEIQMQLSNSYGIPEFLIKSELLGDKSKPGITDTHIFGIPKDIIESELNEEPEESEEADSLIMTSTTYTAGNEPINLIDQHFVHELEDNVGDDLPFNGIPLSMLNAELRSRPEEGDGYNFKFGHGSRDEKKQLSTPPSTFYVVEDDSRSSTIPFLTTEKADGSFFQNFMSIFSQS